MDENMVEIQPRIRVPAGPYCQRVSRENTPDGLVETKISCRFCGVDSCILFNRGTLETVVDPENECSVQGKSKYCLNFVKGARKENPDDGNVETE